MKVIHLIDDFSRINVGIFNAALANAKFSKNDHFAWFQNQERAFFNENFSQHGVTQLENLNWEDFDLKDTVFISHGSWMQPSQQLLKASEKGYQTVYTPHGMLEPWSMKHKWLKKKVYFHWKEKRPVEKASAIRAVSQVEQGNLEKLFPGKKIRYIPNGSEMRDRQPDFNGNEINVLFLGRLHFKKGIKQLAKAWIENVFNPNWKLLIAGPDEGELSKIEHYLGERIKYMGPVYGEEKEELMAQCHFFALPSLSEGFPTSVVDALGYGMIPLISEGCNFNQVFDQRCGLQMEPNEEQITGVLDSLMQLSTEDMKAMSKKSLELAKEFEIGKVSKELDDWYGELLAKI